MTAHSEMTRMGLYQQIEQDGLTSAQMKTLFDDEMRRYRDALCHQVAKWQVDEGLRTLSDTNVDLHIFQAIWMALAGTGLSNDPLTDAEAEQWFGELAMNDRFKAQSLLGRFNLKDSVTSETAWAMRQAGVTPNPTNTPVATQLILLARAAASYIARTGNVPDDLADAWKRPSGAGSIGLTSPSQTASQTTEVDTTVTAVMPGTIDPRSIPVEWLRVSESQIY